MGVLGEFFCLIFFFFFFSIAHLKMKKEVGEKKERKPMVETLYYSSYIERSDRSFP